MYWEVNYCIITRLFAYFAQYRRFFSFYIFLGITLTGQSAKLDGLEKKSLGYRRPIRSRKHRSSGVLWGKLLYFVEVFCTAQAIFFIIFFNYYFSIFTVTTFKRACSKMEGTEKPATEQQHGWRMFQPLYSMVPSKRMLYMNYLSHFLTVFALVTALGGFSWQCAKVLGGGLSKILAAYKSELVQ